ncbi:hypothetical protein ACA910_011241 [Epithemia clementina (nom. ined.)]
MLGFISLNSDAYVERKLRKRRDFDGHFLDIEKRTTLVKMALSDLSWMSVEDQEGISVDSLRKKYPHLKFARITMNSADDVVRSRKWEWAGKPTRRRGGGAAVDEHNSRFITMGRRGDTERVLEGMKEYGIKSNPYFIIGPELPAISSTQARAAFAARDREMLHDLLHPQVTEWCLEKGSWSHNQNTTKK